MSLQTRATDILTKPAEQWPIIAAEPADVASVLRDYAAPLSAIPAVCRFIGLSIVGIDTLFGRSRIGILPNFASNVVAWVFGLVGAWLAAIVIEKLAPTFQSKGDTTSALKLVVYSMTPVWVAGVLNLVPALSMLALVAGLYAIYVFYLGLPVLMDTPPDKVIPYMAVSALVIIVVSALVAAIAGGLVGVGTYTASL